MNYSYPESNLEIHLTNQNSNRGTRYETSPLLESLIVLSPQQAAGYFQNKELCRKRWGIRPEEINVTHIIFLFQIS